MEVKLPFAKHPLVVRKPYDAKLLHPQQFEKMKKSVVKPVEAFFGILLIFPQLESGPPDLNII